MNYLGSISIMLAGAASFSALLFLLLSRGTRDILAFFHTSLLRSISRVIGKRENFLGKKLTRLLIRLFNPSAASLNRMGPGSESSARFLMVLLFIPVVIAFILFITSLLMNNLTSAFTALHSSFDIPEFLQATAVAWSDIPGEILLFALFSSIITSAIVIQRVGSNALFVSLYGLTVLLMAMIFLPDAQPFRAFPESLKVGAGADPGILHWTRIVEAPFLFGSISLFIASVTLFFESRRSGRMGEAGKTILVLSLGLAALAIMSRIAWNYQMSAAERLWNWIPSESAMLSYFLAVGSSLASWSLETAIRKRPGFLTGVVITLSMALSYLGLQARFVHFGQANPTFASSLYFAIISIVTFFILLHALFAGGFSMQEGKGEPKMDRVHFLMVTQILIALLFALGSGIIAATGAIPQNCLPDEAGRSVCHMQEIPFTLYDSAAYAFAFIEMILLGSLSLLNGAKKTQGKNRIVYSAGGALLITAIIGVSLVFFFPSDGSGSFGKVTGISLYLPILFAATYAVIAGITGLVLHAGTTESPLYGGLAALALVVAGLFGSLAAINRVDNFHYYLMLMFPAMDPVHYYSGDKSYLGDIQIESGDLFIGPLLSENVYKTNRLMFNVAQEVHFRAMEGGSRPPVQNQSEDITPYQFANRPRPNEQELLHRLTGWNADGRLISRIVQHPVVDPAKGEVIRGGPFGSAMRKTLSVHDTSSYFFGDLNVRLLSLRIPGNPAVPDLSHIYEYFYFDAGKSAQAYYNFFPRSLVASVQIRLTPGLKLLWVGLIGIFAATVFYTYGAVLELIRSSNRRQGK